jgi:serine/threonine-protein kinase
VIGRTIAHYKVTAKLGAGGMGEVYRATDTKLDRDVALKVLPTSSFRDEAARARLLREARAAASLNHPYICTIYEVGEAEGQAYIAMELVEGQPVSGRLADGPLLPDQVLRYGGQIADALAHAHEHGVIHRDLKSPNVVITPEGRAKVLDFGLAKRATEGELGEATRSQLSLTAPGVVAGTLAYMSPEQLRGEHADARSDIWALGVVLYEMAAGARPFHGHTGFELSSAIMREEPAPLPPHISAGLRAVIRRCLEKEPNQRYQRAAELQAALEAVSSATSQARVAPVAAAPAGRLTFRGWQLGLLATLLLLVLAVALNVGRLRDRLLGRASAPRIESLAVLPLDNMSGDANQEFFADGMTEALITELAQLRGLKKVTSRTSVMQFKKKDKSMPEIARLLGVDAVIEGSVQRAGDKVAVTVQLIDAVADKHLWAKSYERDLRDVISLQREVARAITEEINVNLSPADTARLAALRPVNPHAYELYLRGRFYWSQRTDEGLKKGLEYFNQAVAEDPTYALAWAGVADAYLNMGGEYRVLPPPEARPRAKAAALKALDLDPDLGEAHASLGLWYFHQWEWTAAEKEFQRAVELAPNYATAHHWYALLLNSLGHDDEALLHLRRAQALDPLYPSLFGSEAWFLYQRRRYDEAIEKADQVAKLFPDFSSAYMWKGLANLEIGKFQEAIADLEHAVALWHRNPGPLGRLGYVYGRAGRRAEALKIVAELEKISKQRYVSPFDRALVHAGLDERDQALAWLEKAYEVRDAAISLNKRSPWFDRLRTDPRFQEMLRRTNFPE